uniref:putative sperm motility kinase W n=1 Tax=Arvicanthis niloticus TaxID=61156 RepID=UPI0014863421|nr:putative sperm motility kinase W [Arvicanthis niloticus]
MASHSQKRNLKSQYRMLSPIGHGEFGTVNLACHRKTKALVAIKTIEITEKHIKRILSEIEILKTLHHPNIICLYQVLITSKHVHLVTEFAPGGTLFDMINKDDPLREEEAKKIFWQIVSALKYCHNLDIVHRDIKPQNIVEDKDGLMKLIDFGLAIKQTPGTLLNVRCGTKRFAAPEILLGEPYDGKKSDVWCLGVLLYFMTTGYYPFRKGTIKEIEEKIITSSYDIPTHFSGQLENLVHQMLTVPPEKRSSIEDVERHPWVLKSKVNNLIVADPDYNIIDMLCGMGFDANEIIESLYNKKYDEQMGTYLILKDQVYKGLELGSTTSDKPLDPCPTLSPSQAHPSIFRPPINRRASEPNFGLLYIRPSREQGPVALTLPGHKVARSVSMPPIPLHCPEKKTSSTSTCVLHFGAVALPCVCNSILEDELPVPPEQHSDIKTSSPPKKPGRFKRIRVRLSRLCCFPCARKTKTRHTSSKEVAPLREAGGRTQ